MIPFFWDKQFAESIILDFDGSDTVATGDSISSVSAKIFDEEGTDVSAAMLEGAPSFTTDTVQVQVKAGDVGKEYSLQLLIYTTNGEVIEDDLEVRVRAKSYVSE